MFDSYSYVQLTPPDELLLAPNFDSHTEPVWSYSRVQPHVTYILSWFLQVVHEMPVKGRCFQVRNWTALNPETDSPHAVPSLFLYQNPLHSKSSAH